MYKYKYDTRQHVCKYKLKPKKCANIYKKIFKFKKKKDTTMRIYK